MNELTLQHVFQAAATVKGIVRRTELLESNRLGPLYLKPELLQPDHLR